MKKISKIIAISAMISFAIIFLSCGGSEIGNPMVVVGAICDSTGRSIACVDLFLIDSSESDPDKLVADSCIQAITGPDGTYRFVNVHEGNYSLYGYADNGNKMILKRIALLNDDAITQEGIPMLVQGTDTIKSSANVIIKVDACASNEDNFIYIPNTVIHIPVDSCGEYLVKCPASNVDLLYFSKDTQEVLRSDLTLSSGQWLDLTGNTYIIPKPEITAGIVNGSIGKQYVFSVEEIALGTNHPVQYRFNWGNSTSFWNLSNAVSHTWDSSGVYQVSVQARSLRDTISLSEWSDSISVSIIQ